MTTINQLLTLIEMSGMKGNDEIALRVGETIAPMESCTFHEMNGRTALMFQGGRKQPAQETPPECPHKHVTADSRGDTWCADPKCGQQVFGR